MGDYPVIIEPGLFTRLHRTFASVHQGQSWVVLTHPLIWELYGIPLSAALDQAGINPIVIQVPEGESTKSLLHAGRVISTMLDHHCDRSTWLVTFGGGVIGDLGGFVASVFMRGISYLQLPTTLLAMVDSSIGGKTGVNTDQGKNLIGSIYPPQFVLSYPEILKTLPARQIFSAAAEIVKTAAISDPVFLWQFSQQLSKYRDDPAGSDFSDAIVNTCRFKGDIVSRDERETGLRKILNFGHTVGHALETFYGNEYLTHGESVAYGMQCAGFISCRFGREAGMEESMPLNDWETLRDAIHGIPLPPLNRLDPDSVLTIMKQDKKNVSGNHNFILLQSLGKPVISRHVTDELIKISLEQL